MEANKPIWSEKDIERVKKWLRSPEGIAKIQEVCKGKSEIDKMTERSEEISWWHRIKDIPFTI